MTLITSPRCAAGEYDDHVYRVAVSHGELALEDCAAISAHCGEDDFSVEMNGENTALFSLKAAARYMDICLCFMCRKYALSAMMKYTSYPRIVSKQLFFERRQTADGTAEEILSALFDGEFSDEEHFKIRAQATYLSNFNPELACADRPAALHSRSRRVFTSSDGKRISRISPVCV